MVWKTDLFYFLEYSSNCKYNTHQLHICRTFLHKYLTVQTTSGKTCITHSTDVQQLVDYFTRSTCRFQDGPSQNKNKIFLYYEQPFIFKTRYISTFACVIYRALKSADFYQIFKVSCNISATTQVNVHI